MNVAYVVIRPSPALPHPVRQALARRRQATLTGRCACGARLSLEGRIGHATMGHESDCPASNDALRALLDEHGVRADDLEQELVVAKAPA